MAIWHLTYKKINVLFLETPADTLRIYVEHQLQNRGVNNEKSFKFYLSLNWSRNRRIKAY
jgi:hypothetical protein